MTKQRIVAWIALVTILVFARASGAAPTAHILRIDPRAGIAGGTPVLTTVIEIAQFTPMPDAVTKAGCGQLKGNPLLDCISSAVEAKNALWTAFPFPASGAHLTVKVDGVDMPATFDSKALWASAGKDPLVGTAWLVALDASSMMGPRYEDARQVANQFIGTMGPNDIAKLIIFDDRISPYVANSGWVPKSHVDTLVDILKKNTSPSPSHQRSRPLFNQIKNIATSFGDLGNTGSLHNVPLHQAMVVLSNGAGREDVASASVSADTLKQYATKGRFPEDNTLAPKTPLPIISIFFPNSGGLTNDVYASNDLQFMQDLANTEIGGFFDIVRAGQGVTKAKTILSIVKQRFDQMWVVKWRLACLATTPQQSFSLLFRNTQPDIVPDGSFKDVPIGVDPTSWPLDIDIAQTKAEAESNPVRPGGTIRIYGDFCWGGDKNRVEAYFIPAGTKPDQNVNRNDPGVAQKAMKSITAQNMHSGAIEATQTSVTINVPDEEKVIDGTGDTAVARLVLYDNRAQRVSGVTADTVLTLKAGKKPLNLTIILGGAGLVVVILLLIILLLRGGGGRGRRGHQPPPAPVVAGGGGMPPYGGMGGGSYPGNYGGGPPPGNYSGGYGASSDVGNSGYGAPPPDVGVNAQAAQAPFEPSAPPYQPPFVAPIAAVSPATPSAAIPPAPPDWGGGDPPLAVAGGASAVQVRCPACNMLTMAAVGQGSVCFSCGQPLPRDLTAGGAPAPAAPAFPLTGYVPEIAPPPNPYGPTGATILGAAGQFAIRAGVEVRVGRDPAECAVTLAEPRISGVHATLKFEAGQLFVRDERSNNGTFVEGARVPADTWTYAPAGSTLRFGPVEFVVRIN